MSWVFLQVVITSSEIKFVKSGTKCQYIATDSVKIDFCPIYSG